MLEIAERLLPLIAADQHLALATVVSVTGRAPTRPGTTMALTRDGAVIADLSRTCTDVSVLEALHGVLRGAPQRVLSMVAPAAAGTTSQLPADEAPACGAVMRILVHRPPTAAPERRALLAALRRSSAGEPARLTLITSGPDERVGALWSPQEDDDLLRSRIPPGLLGAPEQITHERHGLFVDVFSGAPLLVIVGATEVARVLAELAAMLGHRVLVCDPRPAFATPQRVPAAHAVVTDFAHRFLPTVDLDERSAVCLLTHDDDLDPLALAAALETPARYIGALGSRATHEARLQRLELLGVTPSEASRLHSPIGLDIGAAAPAEIALAIMAEVVAERSGSSGRPLRSVALRTPGCARRP